MSLSRGLSRDKVLFRILKSKSPAANSLCEKLNHNVKNIVALTEDELCELWQYMKTILLEARKLYTHTSNKNRYEHNLMIKLIRTITALALETILQRIFIPNIMLQNIMLLYSVILPNIKDEQATDEISYLLENWWKLGMTWKEKVVTNVIKHLVRNCKSSRQHVKRLYEIRSSIKLLTYEGVQELFKLVREKTVMSLEEGRLLIAHLFTLGEEYIMGVHNNVKVILQNVGHTYIDGYADLYVTGWLNLTGKLKNFIVENCFQNIVFHCFRAYRDSNGRGKLGKNLLSFLAAVHNSQNETARLMIHDQCKSLLWKHVKASGSFIRCNAVDILFMTSTIYYTSATKNRNNAYREKFYKAISDLLKDSNYEVCNVTMNALFIMLKQHWNHVPKDIVCDWLNVLLHYTKSSDNSELRANVFIGLKKILTKERSRKIVRNFLPNFASSIYDQDSNVLKALIELLQHAQCQVGIPFWNIVPFTYILDRLETTQDTFLLQELTKLIWLRISLNEEESDKMMEDLVYLGTNNINAIRKFCFHSKLVINWEVSVKLIESLLSAIKEEMESITLTQSPKKKVKLSNEKNESISNRQEVDSFREMQIYIDIAAMLLAANIKNIDKEDLNDKELNILHEMANILPELLKYFKETSENESLIFSFSSIPLEFFCDKIEVIEMLVKQLCNPSTSDDILVTIIYVLMKWNKGLTILFALSNIFRESLNIGIQNNQSSSCDTSNIKINERGIELTLRILKHVFNVEYKSVLMNKYHQEMLKFWETLHIWRAFIKQELETPTYINNSISKDLVVKFFNEYVSMILLLHKEDVFDASEYFSEILLWVRKTIVSHIARTYVDTESHQLCIYLIKCIFDISNLFLKDYNTTPKLCCDIVFLYCSCLPLSGSTVLFNDAFNAVLTLLDFSKMAYENQEKNLLDIVVPNFVCVIMVTLTKYKENVLSKHTNNLKILKELTQKYFSIIKSTFNDQRMCLPYITIMFNTAISSLSTEITSMLQNASITDKSILLINFPYLAKKVLKILNGKKYQKLSVQVLTNTITSYKKIDMLSALVIIHKMLKSSDKKTVNRLKNITLATKVHSQKHFYNTSLDRSISDAMKTVIDAILQ